LAVSGRFPGFIDFSRHPDRFGWGVVVFGAVVAFRHARPDRASSAAWWFAPVIAGLTGNILLRGCWIAVNSCLSLNSARHSWRHLLITVDLDYDATTFSCFDVAGVTLNLFWLLGIANGCISVSILDS